MNHDSKYGASKRLDESMRRHDNYMAMTLIITLALAIIVIGLGALVLWRYIL